MRRREAGQGPVEGPSPARPGPPARLVLGPAPRPDPGPVTARRGPPVIRRTPSNGRAVAQPRLFLARNSLATAEASFLSVTTSLTSSPRVVVSSLAETAL